MQKHAKAEEKQLSFSCRPQLDAQGKPMKDPKTGEDLVMLNKPKQRMYLHVTFPDEILGQRV